MPTRSPLARKCSLYTPTNKNMQQIHSPSTRKCCALLSPINFAFGISSYVLSLQKYKFNLKPPTTPSIFSAKTLHDSEIMPTFAA